jgi:redox-sensitive bicupin YhaK (pirin superfamily)
MTNLAPSSSALPCTSDPVSHPALEALPGRATELGELAIRRLLPRSRRRLVGPWCFCDVFGPLSFESGKPMDVAPHPHIGLQTVSWILEGQVLHNDSLGEQGLARRGVLNLMTSGRGIAHSEETPPGGEGRLHGVQLWVALPDAHRQTEPAFEQHASIPVLEREGGRITLLMGEMEGERSPARAFSALVGAELRLGPTARLAMALDVDFEHALVPLVGRVGLEGHRLLPGTLYYLGCGRRQLILKSDDEPATALLVGGAPLGEDVLMWWNFVARRPEEMVAAREDWESGRRFGEVRAYGGGRLPAPPLGRLARR